MTQPRVFNLVHEQARRNAAEYVGRVAPDGWTVRVAPPSRTLDQNARFHAIVDDVAKSGALWGGKTRTPAQWKVLFVSGHAMATGEGAEIVPGLENEFVNLRESTAAMTKRRGASLITYTLAWCDLNGIRVDAPAEAEA